MRPRERQPTDAGAGFQQYQYPSGRRTVVTTPSWAHDLPPDELSDDEEPGVRGDLLPTRSRATTTGSNRRTSGSGPRNRFDRATSPASQGPRGASTGTATEPATAARPKEGEDGPSPSTSASSQPASSSADHPLLPALPPEAHAEDETQRNGGSQMLPPPVPPHDRGWWTFTLPGKYLDRVHGYINSTENGGEKGKSRPRETDLETAANGAENGAQEHEEEEEDDDVRSLRSTRSVRSWISRASRRSRSRDVEKRDYHRRMSHHFNLRLPNAPKVFSLNQTTTPGWSTPWTPFRREHTQNDHLDPFERNRQQTERLSKRSRLEKFILENPFSPLFIRTINLCLVAASLGVAAHIRIQEQRHNAIGIMGSSTLFAIIVAPFAICHIFITLYIEYFGRPIGLWKIGKKMFYTLTELIFICLYSAILSLVFGDLFTSSLECTSWTPYRRYNLPPPSTVGKSDVDGTVADSICQEQIAQSVLIFLAVVFYICVLVISLWRIFAKVSRRT